MVSKILLIKNMVCHRCVLAVEEIFRRSGIAFDQVLFGEVYLKEAVTQKQHKALGEELSRIGFELIDDKRKALIEQIKNFAIESVHYKEDRAKEKFSVLLAQHLHHDYSYLSNLFSDVEGITIEQYLLLQRIEKVKELLMYDQLSLTEIAIQLGYSSTAHLSAQFKKLTGSTASAFKEQKARTRKPLDEIGNRE